MQKFSSNAGQPIQKFEVLKLSSALALIKKLQSNGKIFRVDFKKKDGSNRTMNCRFGVRKGLTGKGSKYNATDKGLLTVWESGEGWKNISVDTIQLIKYGGVLYLFSAPIPAGEYGAGVLNLSGRTVPAHTSPLYV